MDIMSLIKANQLVPISKARAILPDLVEEASLEDFFILVKRYQPKAALVNLKFFTKLLDIYHRFQREKDFISLEKIQETIPQYPEKEIEKDIKNALKAVRETS